MDVGLVAVGLIEDTLAFLGVGDGDDVAGQRGGTVDGELRLELGPLLLAVERLVAQILGALHRRKGLGGPVAPQVGLAARQAGQLPARVRVRVALRLTLPECQQRHQHADCQHSGDRSETIVHVNPPYEAVVIIRNTPIIAQDRVVRNPVGRRTAF